MTTNPSPPNRLDRIEQLLETLTLGLIETRLITDSNARAIAAWSDRIDENQEEALEAADNAKQRAIGVEETTANNGNNIEILIAESRENNRQHQAFVERFDRHQQELADERRESNLRFDRLLGEIQRIWQRLAG